jgi:hypothetical protein
MAVHTSADEDAARFLAIANVHATDERAADGIITQSRGLRAPVNWEEEAAARLRISIQNGSVDCGIVGHSPATDLTAYRLSYSPASSNAGEPVEPDGRNAATGADTSEPR